MGKSNGGTRAGNSGNPRGLSGGSQMDIDVRAIQKTSFKDMGGGMWELNTPHADASILLSEDYMGNKEYEIQTVGAENLKNGTYSSASPGRRFSTLNAAKEAARGELEDYYKKMNS